MLTPEQASEFYAEHFGKPFFPSLVADMSSGPIIALVLAREKAVTHWQELIGPTNPVKARTTHPDRQALQENSMLYMHNDVTLGWTGVDVSIPFAVLVCV